jgi:hypothetical protein
MTRSTYDYGTRCARLAGGGLKPGLADRHEMPAAFSLDKMLVKPRSLDLY